MSYYDLLQDAKWSQKRKKIMQRDGWQCTVCGSKNTLVVHHTYYKNGLNPWEYPDGSLLTLCQDCHHKYHTEHELTIVTKEKPAQKQKRKPKFKKEKEKKPHVIPLTKIQAERGTRYRRKINGVWYYFINTEQKKQIEKS